MNFSKISQEEYKTKDGKKIIFEELPFYENNDGRGWVVHRINAYIDGQLAGYISLSYIPKEKWNSIYGDNIWIFRKFMLGKYDIPDEFLNASDKEIAKDHEERYPYFTGEDWVKNEKKSAKDEFDLHYLYFVDKPIVDFIRTEEDFQRQRVSYNLHQYASKWLKNKFGLKLWLSYCRTDEGKCFYDSKLLELRKYRYNKPMGSGFRRTREYIASKTNWYKKAQNNILIADAEKWIEKYSKTSGGEKCLVYGKCDQFADDFYDFLNDSSSEYWSLFSINDDELSNKLPYLNHDSNLTKEIMGRDIPLTYLGSEHHIVIKWKGFWWDGHGKQSLDDIMKYFDKIKNPHWFKL